MQNDQNKKRHSKQINVHFTPEDGERIALAARFEQQRTSWQVTKSAIVRIAVQEYLERHEATRKSS